MTAPGARGRDGLPLAMMRESRRNRPILFGEIAAKIVADLQFRRQVLRLHDRGPRLIPDEAWNSTSEHEMPPTPIREIQR